MIIVNPKPISEIKSDKEQQTIAPLLDLYEAIATIGEELAAVQEENQRLKDELAALKGGNS
ncbi:hypothetical protein V3851_07565 [Paenibacillus sp. M1]|uniref:Uncharacterized protein n=1 Tax=Paenibacillus haidiansis TaxID=1574488 RepID=A0ABU7VS35_9BACL